MCFGVRDAIAAALEHEKPADVTVWGELVHNERVLDRLRGRGLAMVSEEARAVPPTPDVLLTAHGVSRVERVRLRLAGKRLIDTTCPLVTRAHDAATALQRQGYHVVVVGKPDHVEVRGLVGDLWSYDVFAQPADVRSLPQQRLGVVCQTTTPANRAREVVAELRRRNPGAEIVFADTICEPTKQRIRAAESLARRCDAVVVVGGKNSNNTRQLAAVCSSLGARAFHVQSAADLVVDWFTGCDSVGVTAGTSTTDEVIDEVVAALERLGR